MNHLLLPAPDPDASPAVYTGKKKQPYFPSKDLITAANSALILGAPLLLTGEPGCGKTEFAWVVARKLAELSSNNQPEPLCCYVRSDSKAQDLLYSYDALRRFADAHHGGQAGASRAEDSRNYIEIEDLGYALLSPVRRVVLIDELDKAQRDMPNDLLRQLDKEEGSFTIPEIPKELPEWYKDKDKDKHPTSRGIPLKREMLSANRTQRPLCIITSNVERQLPDAFLRRCIFYYIEFPERADLLRILRSASPKDPKAPKDHDKHESPLLEAALDVFLRLRAHKPKLSKPPATAELLDWVATLREVHIRGDRAALSDVIDKLGKALVEAKALGNLPGLCCLLKQKEDWHSVVRLGKGAGS